MAVSDRIDIHIRTERGVPTSLLAAIGKALEAARPGATLDGVCDCCNFHLVGGGP